MEENSVRNFAIVFSGLGGVAVVTLLGSLWLVQASGSVCALIVAVAQGLALVSSLLGLLSCYRCSRDLQLDRETEVRSLLGYAVYCLLPPLVVDFDLTLTALFFPQPLQLFAEVYLGLNSSQSNILLPAFGLFTGALTTVLAAIAVYGIWQHKQWNLAHDSLLLQNALLLFCSGTVFLWSLQGLAGTSNLQMWAALFGMGIAYLGWVAVHSTSMDLLRTDFVLLLLVSGIYLISAVNGWVTSQKTATLWSTSCLDTMAVTHTDTLHALRCESKYTSFGPSEDLPCPKGNIRYAWDKPEPEFGCLNNTCCSEVSRSVRATAESLAALQISCLFVGVFAASLILALIKQLAYDNNEHFGDHCILLSMLTVSAGLILWYSLSGSYPGLPDVGTAIAHFAVPERLLSRGGCVVGLQPAVECTQCSYSVTADNALIYEHLKVKQRPMVQGTDELKEVIVCAVCLEQPLTVFVTQGGGKPDVHTFDWSGQMRLTGSVSSEFGGIGDVEIIASISDCHDLRSASSSDGSFAFLLPFTPDHSPYNLTLHFQKDGYRPSSRTEVIEGLLAARDIRLPTVRLAKSSLLFSSVALYAFDALANQRMKDGRVELREGYNNLTGPVKTHVTVSAEGVAMLEDLRAGTYTVTCSLQGWYTGVSEIEVAPNTHSEKAALMTSITTEVLRVVLAWQSPQDLDLRVTFKTEQGRCEVSFANKACGGTELHADNHFGGSSGGEALSIWQVLSTTYLFAVSLFDANNTVTPLGESAAELAVYAGNSPLPVLRIPVPEEAGGRWAALCLDAQVPFFSLPDKNGECSQLPSSHEDLSNWAVHP